MIYARQSLLLLTLSAGVLSTDIFQGIDRNGGEYSDQCRDSLNAYGSNPDYRDPYDEYSNETLTCVEFETTTILDIFAGRLTDAFGLTRSSGRGYPSPCTDELVEFAEMCEDNDGDICFVQFDIDVRIRSLLNLLPIPSLLQFSVGYADCLPRDCDASDDYDALSLLLDPILNAALDNRVQFSLDNFIPGNNTIFDGNFDLESQLRFFCVREEIDNGQRRYRPRQYGPGLQTTLTHVVDTLFNFDLDTIFNMRCNDCTPQWAIDIDLDADVMVDGSDTRQRRSWEQVAYQIANQLSRNEDFQESECISNYNAILGALDIVCPEGTGMIEMREAPQDGGEENPWQAITEYVSTASGFSLQGDQTAFDTPVTNNAGADAPDGENSASTLAPLAPIAVASLVALTSQH